MTDRELMQQALEALEALELLARYEHPATRVQVRKPRDGGHIVTVYPHKVATEAAASLRERLAQPEQEPVAKAWNEGYRQGVEDECISAANIGIAGFGAKVKPARQNPYGITPPQRKPLTDEELETMAEKYVTNCYFDTLEYARAIEAAHGIKENT